MSDDQDRYINGKYSDESNQPRYINGKYSDKNVPPRGEVARRTFTLSSGDDDVYVTAYTRGGGLGYLEFRADQADQIDEDILAGIREISTVLRAFEVLLGLPYTIAGKVLPISEAAAAATMFFEKDYRQAVEVVENQSYFPLPRLAADAIREYKALNAEQLNE